MNVSDPLASADYFQRLVDQTAISIMHLEAVRNDSGQLVDFQIKFANQVAGQLINRQPAGTIGQRLSKLAQSAYQPVAFDRCSQVVLTGQSVRYEQLYDTNEIQQWFSVTVTPFGDGVLITMQDITAQKRAELANLQQADLLQSIIDNSPSAIVLYEPIQTEQGELVDFQYKLVNPAAAAVTGKSVDDLLSSTLLTLYGRSQSNPNELFDRLIRVWQTGVTQQFERYTELNGTKLWANVTLVRQGKNVLAVLEFVTKLKDVLGQLEQQNSALARSNESLQSFAYIASHDLQEPLRKIQQFGSLLKTLYAPALDKQGHSFIERMESAAQRMASLIHDLLALSRLTSQSLPFHPVNLNTVVADVLTDLETGVEEKGALITIDQLPTIRGDALQLRQLFQNLFSNALKFAKTDANSLHELPRIQVNCQWVSADNRSVLLREGYRIQVIDNGIGFDSSQAERIFGAFQRLHSRQQYEGTGIGLAIARKVVDNHNGTITAESRPGEGSIFTIYLPA